MRRTPVLVFLLSASFLATAFLIGGCPPPPPELERGPFSAQLAERALPIAELDCEPELVDFSVAGETKTLALRARLFDGTITPLAVDSPNVQWTSSNPAVATIQQGVVTAVATGDTVIKASINNVSDEVVASVHIPLPVDLVLEPTTAILDAAGQTLQLLATLKRSDGSELDATQSGLVTFASSDPLIATVSDSGLVTAVATGGTVVTARLGNLSAAITVDVRIPNRPPLLASIGNKSVDLGSTLRFQITATDPENAPVSLMVGPLPLPANTRFSIAAREFTFRPTADQVGQTFRMVFSASDGLLTASEAIDITVNPVPENGETALVGRLLDTNDFVRGVTTPVVGATVALLGNGASAVTDSDGQFRLAPLPAAGVQVFDIDPVAAQSAPDGSPYAGFREAIELFEGVTNIVDRPFFLPRIEVDSLTTVDPTRTTVVRNARLNITMTVPPGVARNLDGTPFTGQLSISEVPDALAPASLPEFLEPGLLITIQPVGVTYAQPVPISFANIDNLPPNAEVNLWSLDPSQGTFAIFGRLRVSADGATLQTVQGGVAANDWHGPAPNLPNDDNGSDETPDNNEDCGSVSGNSSTALRSGRLQETHALASYRSMGRTQSWQLVYNSTSADPQPIASSFTTIAQNTAVPRTLSTRIAVGGIEIPGEFHTSAAGFRQGVDESVRQAIQFDAGSIPTGLYPYRLRLASNYDRTTVSRQRANMTLINNERNSAFGAGWTLAGLQRLHIQPNSPKVVLTEGDGRIKTFTPQGASGPVRTDIAFVMDGSGSIASGDFQLQIEGVARAVENPLVFPRDGSVSLAVVQFAGISAVIEIPLTTVTDDASAAALAVQIRSITQRSGGTPMAEGLVAGTQALASSPAQARQVICLSTDGVPNDRQAALNAADAAVAAGIDEIDALAVGGGADVSFLETMVRNGFVVTVTSFQQFADEIGDKLRSVIGGSPPGDFSFILANENGTFTRVMKDGTRHHFSANGLHVETVELSGLRTRFAYDANGALQTITDQANLVTTFSYSNGRLSTVTDPAQRITSFEHDPRGCLTRIVDPDASERRFSYDGRMRLTGQVDQRGGATTYQYGFHGRQVGSVLPDSSTQSISPAEPVGIVNTANGRGTFDNPAPAARPDDHKAKFIDREGGLLNIRLNRFGRPIRWQTALGLVTQSVVNDQNLPTRVIHPNGRVDEMRYDELGNLLELTEAVGTPLQRITRYEYHPQFHRVTAIDQPAPNNENRRIRTTFEYDAAGNLVRVVDPLSGMRERTYVPGTNLVATSRDENMNVTMYGYDAKGLLEQVTDAEGGITRYVRDERGNVLSITEAFGTPAERTRRFTYDAQDRVLTATDGENGVTQFRYDAKGNLLETENPTGQIVRRTYDSMNMLTQVEDPIRGVTRMTYDRRGNLLTQTDALGARTRFVYDHDSRLIRSIDALNGVEQYQYDASGNVTQFTDANNHSTSFQYDLLNRRTRRTNALQQFSTFAHDALDNLTVQLTPNGHTITNTYDDLSRLITTVTPDNTITYSYDAVGNLRFCADNDSNLEWTYDRVNRVHEAKTLAGPNVVQPETTITYSYDAAGNRVRMLDSLGGDTRYAYDGAGRLRFLTTPASDVIEETYDPAGRLDAIIYPNGITADYQYDQATGRLARLTHASATSTLLDFQYSYNPVGNIVQIVEPTQTRTFTYDALQRLRTGGTAASPEFYDYDAVGNRTRSHLSQAHVHDAANRLLQDDQFDYIYDANGNLTTKSDRASGEVTEYAWSAHNQLLNVSQNTDVFATFLYDGTNRRIVVNSRAYVLDKAHILVMDDDGIRSRYSYGDELDQVLAVASPTLSTSFVHTDHLGSVSAVTAESGSLTGAYSYTSYGARASVSGNSPMLDYIGRELDPETGLLYLRARYYSAESGVFLSSDPGGFGGGDSNLYRYSRAQPMVSNDPTGRFCIPCLVGGVTAAIYYFFDADAANAPGPGDPVYPNKQELQRLSEAAMAGLAGAALADQLFGPDVPDAGICDPSPTVQENKQRGDAFRDEIGDLFEQNGYDVRREVNKKTPFTNRRMDLEIGRDGRTLGGIETKTGNSPYTPSQRSKDEWLRRNGYPVNVVRDN